MQQSGFASFLSRNGSVQSEWVAGKPGEGWRGLKVNSTWGHGKGLWVELWGIQCKLAWLCQPLTPSPEQSVMPSDILGCIQAAVSGQEEFASREVLCHLVMELLCDSELFPNKEAFLSSFPLQLVTLTLE